MITRKQYLNNTKLHNEYYAQFVTEELKGLVLRRFSSVEDESFGIEKLCAAYEEDTDLNNIALVNWDGLGVHLMHDSRYLDQELIKETGQGYSNAGAVSILKEAARQLIEEHLNDDIEYLEDTDPNYKSLEDIQREDPDNIVIFHSKEHLKQMNKTYPVTLQSLPLLNEPATAKDRRLCLRQLAKDKWIVCHYSEINDEFQSGHYFQSYVEAQEYYQSRVVEYMSHYQELVDLFYKSERETN